MSKNPKKSSLFETIAQNTIGLIATAIFSVGLMGGSGFILFDAQKELNKMAQVNADIGKEIAEFNLGMEMATIGGSGWFSDNAKSGMKLGTIMGLLEASLPIDDLNDFFAKDTIDWSLESLTQLKSEREKIGGYVFSIKTILQSQSAILRVYDTQIILTQEILDLTQHWEEKKLTERQSQFTTIQIKWMDVKAANDALATARSQNKSDLEIAMSQSELKLDEMKDNYNSFSRRIWLSVLGILLGAVLLLGAIGYLAKKHLQPQEKIISASPRKVTRNKKKK